MDRPLCCFLDPEFSSEPRSLEDLCPICGRMYGFPLFDAPAEIRGFKVVGGLNRGFYSAVFHVTQGALEAPYVLKVASSASGAEARGDSRRRVHGEGLGRGGPG